MHEYIKSFNIIIKLNNLRVRFEYSSYILTSQSGDPKNNIGLFIRIGFLGVHTKGVFCTKCKSPNTSNLPPGNAEL